MLNPTNSPKDNKISKNQLNVSIDGQFTQYLYNNTFAYQHATASQSMGEHGCNCKCQHSESCLGI